MEYGTHHMELRKLLCTTMLNGTCQHLRDDGRPAEFWSCWWEAVRRKVLRVQMCRGRRGRIHGHHAGDW